MKALILAAGALRPDAALRALAAEAELVIAADGGVRHAPALGVAPDLIVGDFDSATEAALAHFPDAERQRHAADKDQLDLELALDEAWARGADEVAVFGAFGGRLDQSLAALLIAARARRAGRALSLHGDGADVRIVLGGEARELELPPERTFSLLALDDAVVDLSGARYPLEGAALPRGVGRGVSNVALEGARIRVRSGVVAVVAERPRPTGDARARIWGKKAEAIEARLRAVDPELAELTIGVAYDRVFERPDLDLRTRELLAIALLTAQGDEGQLRTHVWGALNCGATPDEIRESVRHAAMFVGFPRALTAMAVVQAVLERGGERL